MEEGEGLFLWGEDTFCININRRWKKGGGRSKGKVENKKWATQV